MSVIFFAGCFKNEQNSTENLGKLALHMEQLYRRELHKDRFAIHYVPKPPSTILITIQAYPDANRQLILTLTDSAKEIIQRTAPTYQLDSVNVESQTTELSPPEKSE